MRAIYAFGILVILALIGSRFIFRGKKSFTSPRSFWQSGLIYIFLGLYLGESGLDVLSSQILQGLLPVIGLALGWIGFIFGFQFEYKYLKRFPKKYLGLSLLQFLFAFFSAAGIFLVILPAIYPDTERFLVSGLALTFGLFASLHSPTLLNTASTFMPKRGQYHYLARFLVSVGGFWGIMGVALIASFWHYPVFEAQVLGQGLIFLLASTLIPAGLGYIFHLLTIKKTSEQDLLVYLLGLVFFVSGGAFYFNLLPLYAGMVLGITYSNLTRRHERLYPVLLATEKPLYIVLLILIGAMWRLQPDFVLIVPVILVLFLRMTAFALPLPVFAKILRFPLPLPFSLGLSFFSSGGIGVAFAVSLKIAYPIPLTDTFLSIALFTLVVSELLAPWLVKISLFRLDAEE